MGLLRIDRERCQKDEICVSVCPMGIIRMQGEDGYPQAVKGGEAFCIACGHCVAACPHGALSHARMPLEACPPIRKEQSIGEEQAVQFLRTRRSIRLYQDRPVEKEKILRLIEIARYAPTGGNAQLVDWIVHQDRKKVHDLAGMTVDWMRRAVKEDPAAAAVPYLPLVIHAWDAGMDTVLRDAPVLVTAVAPGKDANGLVDLTLALCYLELAAPTLGLGTCWAGILRRALLSSPPLREALGIPEGYPHFYPMMLGYPKIRYYRLPERRPPRITWR